MNNIVSFQRIRKTLGVFSLLALLSMVPVFLNAQINYTDGGTLYATSDSRIIYSVEEFDTIVRVEVLAVGYYKVGAIEVCIYFDSLKLKLTDTTWTKAYYKYNTMSILHNSGDTMYGAMRLSFSTPSWRPEASGAYRYNGTVPLGSLTQTGNPIMSAIKMNLGPHLAGDNLIVQPGQIFKIGEIFFKKAANYQIKPQDFGFGFNTFTGWPLRSLLAFGGGIIANATITTTQTHTVPDMWVFRSPSSVVTNAYSNLTATTVTLNGTYDRGKFKANDLINAHGNVTSGTGIMNRDTLIQRGFIYSPSANMTLKIDPYTSVLQVNGVPYPFPSRAALGSNNFFLCGLDTIFIVTGNGSPNVTDNYAIPVAGLRPNTTYTAAAFGWYVFETSNEYPIIGAPIVMKTDGDNTIIHAQVVTCWDTDTINLAKLLGINPCNSPSVSITSGATTKMGAMVSGSGSNVVYAYATLNNKAVLGYDTVQFILTCGGTAHGGTLIVIVVPCPDNVDKLECVGDPIEFDLAIKEAWRSTEGDVSTYQSPMVGDLDGDGIPDIVVARAIGGTELPSYRPFQNLYVYKGSDRSNPVLIPTVMANYHQTGAYAIARVPVASGDTVAIIVLHGHDGFLYCYTLPGVTPPWTKSSHPIAANYNNERDRGGVAFADFDNCGVPEIYVGNRIFNAATGVMLIDGDALGTNKGRTLAVSNTTFLFHPTVADIDGDGKLEYIAGNRIYKVNITNKNGTAQNTMSLFIESEPISVNGKTVTDGVTAVGDFTGNGQVDVLVASITAQNEVAIAIWDVQTKKVLGSIWNNTEEFTFGIPFVGDVDGDGKLEILMTTRPSATAQLGDLNGFRLEPAASPTGYTLARRYYFQNSDGSGSTGITLFDFNQSGETRLVYRDEDSLRIMRAQPVPNGVGGFKTDATFPAGSGTRYEYAIVADVDNDGAAEIIVTGGTVPGSGVRQGTLRIYKSGNEHNWAPARGVWNQYNYNVLNVNEDLTIPRYQMCPAKYFPNGKQPFNNFLQQQTRITAEGDPYRLLANIIWIKPDPTMVYDGDSLIFHGCIKNIGEAALQVPLFISYYKNDTIKANLIATDSINHTIMKDSSLCFRLVLNNISTLVNGKEVASIWISINDKGTGKYPYQAQCDATGRWEFDFCTTPPFVNLAKKNATICISENYTLTGNLFGGTMTKAVTLTTNGAGTLTHTSEMSPTDSLFTINYIPAPADAGKTIKIAATVDVICGKASDTLYLTIVTTNIPAKPDSIVGLTELRRGSSGNIYYVETPVKGLLYHWTVPAGWTIVRGQDSSDIVVNLSPNAQSGKITVTAIDTTSCGGTSEKLELDVTTYSLTHGSVFPNVRYEESVPARDVITFLNSAFPITATIYPVPKIGTTTNPIASLKDSTPVATTTATYYPISGRGLNPGYILHLDNPGYPINWNEMFGISANPFSFPILEPAERGSTATLPNETSYVGMYSFENVPVGDYILALSRAGYLTRYIKISVAEDGAKIEHRELILGDANDDGEVTADDILLINTKVGTSWSDPDYDPRYDVNSDGKINVTDISATRAYIGFKVTYYTDTQQWLNDYK